MSLGRIFYCVLLAAALAACATTAPEYYTLLPAPTAGPAADAPGGARPKYAISVQPVALPEQVDRPQIVISEPGTAQVTPLNSALWASPLSDEIRNALSNDLSRTLGVLDIAGGGIPDALPVWKISLQVQRFDSLYGQRAVLDATWRLAPVNQPGKKTRICRAQVDVPAAGGMPAMVASHQEALRRLAALIAAQLSGAGAAPAAAGVQEKGCTF
ncbi:PqiC family protein [Pollutimonas bauzanensis]|uniref:ABC-type transport auxiliary lipoprotein component domain-containing protein n=1 Tax=Pollutimonas bauzanensis TaxID=658167 RepID=A0A1M5XW20_9BURK|nr:PqiC family protein [Pollutimonas bauzanensis]SHI03754.1 hypothetical protein SAMN04488135_107166 [Pollutimonas bauzanensis]